MAVKSTYFICFVVLGAAVVDACPPGMIPCGGTSCAPPGGKCPDDSCEDGNGNVIDCKAFKVVHHESMLISSVARHPEQHVKQQQQQQQQQQEEGKLQQQTRQQQQQKHIPHHLTKVNQPSRQPASADGRRTLHAGSSMISRTSRSLLPSAVAHASKQAARKLQQIGGAVDAMMLGGMGDILGMTNTYAGNTGYGNLGGLASLIRSATAMTGFTGNSLTGLNTLNGMSRSSGLSSTGVEGYNSQAHTAYQAAGNIRGNPASFESGFGSGSGYSTPVMQQNSAGSSMDPSLLYNTANGIGNTAWGAATNVGVLAGGKLDAVGYELTAKSSKLNGGMTAANDAQLAQRYGETGANLAYAVAPAVNNVHNTARGMTRTLAPMAQQAITDTAGLKIQASEALPSAVHSIADGAVGVINTVTPYVQGQNNMLARAADVVQQGAAATQQVMHGTAIPMAQGGISAMSNIGGDLSKGFAGGFPEGYAAVMDRRAPYQEGPSMQQLFEQQPTMYLPQSYAPLGAMANITYPCPSGPQNSIAPVGTIIGPGIPCGVPLMVVPKAAVPTNRPAPAVVKPVPVAVPVPPPPSPSPIPIPVTPLPPAGGGGGTTLPPVVPPIVNPGGGSTPGGTPPTVPPIVNPSSPSPGGGTPIPTTPPTTTPGTGTTPTTGDGTPIPTVPPTGLTPPIVNPSPGSPPGPTTAPGAAPPPALRSTSGFIEYSGSRLRGSNSVLAQQQALERQRVDGSSANGDYSAGLTASLLDRMRQGLRRL